MRRGVSTALLCTAVVLGIAVDASAAPIYGTLLGAADFSGSRTEGAGLTGTGRYDNMTVSWSIAESNGVFSYEYKFDFAGSSQNSISHLSLDLSDNCASTSGCVSNARLNGNLIAKLEFATFGAGPSNPGFPANQSITGVKFDDLALNPEPNVWTITFDSVRAPMWGDFYLKGGQDYLFNTGLLAANRQSGDKGLFVAVPDTVGVTAPEPATLLLFGLGAAAAAVRRARRS